MVGGGRFHSLTAGFVAHRSSLAQRAGGGKGAWERSATGTRAGSRGWPGVWHRVPGGVVRAGADSAPASP
jgi:hypothetical protein